MNLQNRLEKLEQRAGRQPDGAACEHGFDLRIYDNNGEGYFIGAKPSAADPTPNKVCQVCGRAQRRLRFVRVKGRDEHAAAGVPLP